MTQAPIDADVLIRNALIVTMDEARRIITDGAIAWAGDTILAVGKTADIEPLYRAKMVIDGRRFVVTPGLINGHIHVTGEPVTRGVVPDDLGWFDNVFGWLIPLYQAQTEEEEHLAAQLAAAEMLRNGVTSFI